MKNLSKKCINISIIGAGISGLSCARSLAHATRESNISITVYEKENRVGGRVFSISTENTSIDLGAGRYSPQLHPNVDHLIHNSNIKIETFNFSHYDKEQDKKNSLRKILIALREKVKKTSKQSFFDFLCAHKGQQKAQNIIETLGYNSLYLPNINAEMGFDIIEKHPETQCFLKKSSGTWFNLVDGFGTLAQHLRREAEQLGVRIINKQQLSQVDCQAKSITLTFSNGHAENTQLLILATPPSTIKKLIINTPVAKNRYLYDSLPLFKGFLFFNTPWWQQHQLHNKVLITNSPISKVYFKKNSHAFFYADSKNANFWQRQIQVGEKQYLNTVTQQLSELIACNIASIPTPTRHIYQYWPRGIEYTLGDVSQHPPALWLHEQSIITCSDAYTTHCGWIEGSLLSAQKATALALNQLKIWQHKPSATSKNIQSA